MFSFYWRKPGFRRPFWIFTTKPEVYFSNLYFFTNHYHPSWKFAIRILIISQLVRKLLAKNQFQATILNFYDKTGSRVFEPLFFKNHYHRSWKFAIRIFNISQLVRKLSAKKGFRRPFWIFATKPEVEFSNLYFLQITTIDLENLPLEFRKYIN